MTTTTVYLARPPPAAPNNEGLAALTIALVGAGAIGYYAWTVYEADKKPAPKADAKVNPATQWISTSASLQQPVYDDTKTPIHYVPANSIPFTQDAGAYPDMVNSNAGSLYVKSGKTQVAVKGPSMGVPLDPFKGLDKLTKAFGKLF